jgi:hypothetical protein
MYTNSLLTSPGNAGDILYIMRVMLFIAFLSMGYTLSRPGSIPAKEGGLMLPDTLQEWTGLPPWQKKASEKAVARYAESQNKKWRRWNEVMFERSA